MTANEFLFEHGSDIHTMGNNDNEVCYCVIQPKDLIAFAKLKVEEALKEANDRVNYSIETFGGVMPNVVYNVYTKIDIK